MQDTPAVRRWRKLNDEFATTNMTARAFAEARGLNPSTFSWWRSRLKKLDAGPQFTELVVARPEPTVVLSLDALPVHVVVDEETDLALLRRLLEALA